MKIIVNSAAASTRQSYGAIEHYRNLGPYDHLRRYMDVPISFEPKNRITEIDWGNFDAFHFQNPCTDNDIKMAMRAKHEGLKVVADYDDDLINLPVNNHNFLRFPSAQERQQFIAKFCDLADAVTVSTQRLHDNLKEWCEPVIIPNSWYKQKQPKATQPPNAVCLWRGSQSHADDIIEFQNEVVDLMQDSKNLRWIFWTDTANIAAWTMDIPSVHEDTENGKWQKFPAAPMVEYMHKMAGSVRPMVTIVPLKNYPFNHAKSNIAWIEATLAGGVAVVPDWHEWQNKGTLRYKNRKEFKEQVMKVLMGKVNVEKMNAESMKEIEIKYNLDINNQKRKEIWEQWV